MEGDEVVRKEEEEKEWGSDWCRNLRMGLTEEVCDWWG